MTLINSKLQDGPLLHEGRTYFSAVVDTAHIEGGTHENPLVSVIKLTQTISPNCSTRLPSFKRNNTLTPCRPWRIFVRSGVATPFFRSQQFRQRCRDHTKGKPLQTNWSSSTIPGRTVRSFQWRDDLSGREHSSSLVSSANTRTELRTTREPGFRLQRISGDRM